MTKGLTIEDLVTCWRWSSGDDSDRWTKRRRRRARWSSVVLSNDQRLYWKDGTIRGCRPSWTLRRWCQETEDDNKPRSPKCRPVRPMSKSIGSIDYRPPDSCRPILLLFLLLLLNWVDWWWCRPRLLGRPLVFRWCWPIDGAVGGSSICSLDYSFRYWLDFHYFRSTASYRGDKNNPSQSLIDGRTCPARRARK